MPITINGTGTIDGIRVGGLENGCVNEADLATAAVTNTKLASGAVTPDKLATTVMGPAFSAKADSGGQSLTATVLTKVLFNTEEFDTANCFASSRFTPNVAGYYQINSSVSPANLVHIQVHKNGSLYKRGAQTTGHQALNVSALVYLNGSTDYIEIYAFCNPGGTVNSDSNFTYFDGHLARPA